VELKALRPFERARVSEAIEAQLPHEPLLPVRHRKPLPGVVPTFEHTPPLWELRVGNVRVFYDVDEAAREVTVRAIRTKGRKSTGEIV
jgi:mRNA-degrading endonuclease RelE of RelBE toxin-antitoxin system